METGSDRNGTSFFLSNKNEFVKQYIELDGQGRASAVYTVHRNAKVGAPCAVTKYVYKNINSTVIIGRVEDSAIWLQAFEDALAAIL